MHTPWKRRFDKVRPNDICPFCGSGKKIKKCNCATAQNYKQTEYTTAI